MKYLPAILLLALAAFAAPHFAYADAAPFQPIVPLPGLSTEQYAQLGQSANGFADYIKLLFKWSISMGAILAVLMFVYGGFQYMTSDAIGDKKKGVGHIRDAVTGLLLLLSVVLILQVINPCILQLNVFSATPGSCSPGANVVVDRQIADSAPDQSGVGQAADAHGRSGISFTAGMCVAATTPANCIQPVTVCAHGSEYWAKGASDCYASEGETQKVICQGGCNSTSGQAIDLSGADTVAAGTTCSDGAAARTACMNQSGVATAPGASGCASNTSTIHYCPAQATLGSLPDASTITSSSGGVDQYSNGIFVGAPGALTSCSNVQHICLNPNRTYTARDGATCTTGTPKDLCPAHN